MQHKWNRSSRQSVSHVRGDGRVVRSKLCAACAMVDRAAQMCAAAATNAAAAADRKVACLSCSSPASALHCNFANSAAAALRCDCTDSTSETRGKQQERHVSILLSDCCKAVKQNVPPCAQPGNPPPRRRALQCVPSVCGRSGPLCSLYTHQQIPVMGSHCCVAGLHVFDTAQLPCAAAPAVGINSGCRV